jgi:oligoendopeptidase F
MKNKALALFAILLLVSTLLAAVPSTPHIVLAAPPAPTPVLHPTTDTQYHWKLEDIYPNPVAWETDFKKVKDTYIPEYKTYQGQLGNKDMLLEFLGMDEIASRTMDKLYIYAHMKLDEDNTNSDATELKGRVDALYTDFGTACSFFRPELIALPAEVLQSYLQDDSLKQYHMLLQFVLEQKAHTLSKEEEAILSKVNQLASAPEDISTKIREADLKFPTITDPKGVNVELSEANYGDLLRDTNRPFREKVYNGILNTYGSMKNSLATALDAQMRKDYFYATTQKYSSSLDAALGANDIPKEVYTSLVNATDKDLDTLHKYVTLRKNVLKIPSVHVYDLYVPIVSGYTPQSFDYAKAQAILREALMPLGDDYLADMNSAFNSRWIDVYPRDHKTSGAYAWAVYDTHPYILLNYTESFDSLLDLGHEMGHALNDYYVNKNQGYYYSNTPIFNAEVASTTNELLVLHYMIDHAKTDEEKLFYLDRLAEDIRGTFYSQVMYAEFELQIHEWIEKGQSLSADTLSQMWGNILAKYYGPDFELTEEAKLGWTRIPHFYYDFYVYQYATGIAAANQFYTMITTNTPGNRDKYLTFLKAGNSDYPVKVLQNSGVDMLTDTPVNVLLTDFDKTVTEIDTLLVKMGKVQK